MYVDVNTIIMAGSLLTAVVVIFSAIFAVSILIYGVDGNPDFMGYVADGSATASAAQQPSVIGQKALDAAIDTLDGKEVEHDQTVDVVLINKDNIADFDVTDWQ